MSFRGGITMDIKSRPEEREVIERIALTEEQRKLIAKHTALDVKNMLVIRLSPEEARRLGPGVISAIVVDVCW
jgi:hypothetical protein